MFFAITRVLPRPIAPLFAGVRQFATKLTSDRSLIRNVAIIAHVDHGKTTLVDQLLRQGGAKLSSVSDRMMDSNVLEKERGITILSKCTRITYKGHILNIVDTPGHADFGGEVERVLSMVDGVILVVDANEGPKSQTKFVLSKALANKRIKPIVVVNKVDRPTHRIAGEVDNDIFDLFVSLDASDEQMEYQTLYGSGKSGFAVNTWDEIPNGKDMIPLFDAIVAHVPEPHVVQQSDAILADEKDKSNGFSLLVSQFDQLPKYGPTATGKIFSGTVKTGMKILCKDLAGNVVGQGKVREITFVAGTTREVAEEAHAGDVVSISTTGFVPRWTQTLCSVPAIPPIECTPIDPPTMAVHVSVNDSPLCGKDGKYTSCLDIGNRLHKEALTNVAIEVVDGAGREYFEVRGRGEMQFGVLIETMRREGFEVSLSPPTVVLGTNAETGEIEEPWEEIITELPESSSPVFVERMALRDAELKDVMTSNGITTVKFNISSRNFLGTRSWLRENTGGQAVCSSTFLEMRKAVAPVPRDRKHVLVSSVRGTANATDLAKRQRDGTIFITDGTELYEGMIFGELNSGNQDIDTNVCKTAKATYDKADSLQSPRTFYLEQALAYVLPDEKLEVTPKRVAMRKVILSGAERKVKQKQLAKGAVA